MENCKLFEGISKDELERMMRCLSPITRTFEKGEIVEKVSEEELLPALLKRIEAL